MNILLIPYLLSTALVLTVAVFAWQRRHIAGAGVYALFAALQGLNLGLYMLELVGMTLADKIFWDNAQWATYNAIAFSSIVFVSALNGQLERHRPLLWGLLLPTTLFIGAAVFGVEAQWYYENPRIEAGFSGTVLVYDFTLLAWLSYIFFIGSVIFSVVVLLARAVNVSGILRRRLVIVAIGFLFPAVMGSLLYLLDIRILGQRDPAPYSIAISNLIIAYGIFRHQLFNVVSIARDFVIESMPDAFVVLDADNRIIDLNPTAKRGMSPAIGNPIGQPIAAVFPGWRAAIDRHSEMGSVDEEVSGEHNSRQIVVQVKSSPIHDRAGKLLGRVIFTQEVTKRKEAEEARRQAEAQQTALMLEQERLRLLTEFIRNTMHEFRTPLSSILTGLHLMQRVNTAEYRAQKTAQIQESVEDIITLLDNMIEMIRLGEERPPEFENTNLTHIMTLAITRLQPHAARKGTLLDYQPAEPPLMLRGDAHLLTNALSNIIDNAIKYSPEGSTITIRATCSAGSIVVKIADDGTGMSPEVQERIFETFYRADEARHISGLGLGLPLAQKIVELHGGHISVVSAVGQGSEFTLTLPMTQGLPGLSEFA